MKSKTKIPIPNPKKLYGGMRKINMNKTKEQRWIYIKDNEIRGIFKNRKDAVKYYKEMLKQSLKVFDKQDKTDGYDYSIHISESKFIPVYERPTYLDYE